MKFVIKNILLQGSYVGILDVYGNAAAAWSVARKLRTGYNGYAINVRRSSDNTSINVGFNGDGTLDTASMLAFCGAGDGYVATIYDQSGNGLDRTQVYPLPQAKIVSSGSLITLNSKPALDFSGTSAYYTAGTTSSWKFLHDGTKSFVSLVQTMNGSASENILNSGGSNSNAVGFNLASRTTQAFTVRVTYASSGNFVVNPQSANNSYTTGTQFIMGVALDINNVTAANRVFGYINGGSNILTNASTGTASSSNSVQALGAPDSSNLYTGKMQEMIFWNIDQTANRTSIRDNQRTFYGTY